MIDQKTISTKEKAAKKHKCLNVFLGFNIIPIAMKSSAQHCIYARKHESRTASDPFPINRTLFVLNLPADTTAEHIEHLFGKHGKITTIFDDAGQPLPSTFDSSPPKNKKRKQKQPTPEVGKKDAQRKVHHSGISAHIIFPTPEDLENALQFPNKNYTWEERGKQPLGFQRYILNCALSRPDHTKLQQEVDLFMLKFKENEYQRERDALERMNKMDEDGFVVVTRHKKAKTTDGSTSVGVAFNKPSERSKKEEHIDFYRFQARERKQNELASLRKRNEEAKQKVEKLKQSRKFRPF